MIQGMNNPFAASGKYAGKRFHLGISGSISCYKSLELLRALLKLDLNISATLSAGAKEFVTPMLFRALGASPVYDEMFADENVFAHLEPGHCCQSMAIVPASANMLARLAHGSAEDMLSAQALAFDGPKLVAPAMNPAMWANAATQRNVLVLEDVGYKFIGPDKGKAACGDSGAGRLASLSEIFFHILKSLSPQDMNGLKVMATIGPTREPWDGVRYWSNPSSGKMGSALATCAWLRGAEVTAICGPGVECELPREIKKIETRTARQMFEAAKNVWPEMNWGLFSAAVADFAPERPTMGDAVKYKKDTGSDELLIRFSRNPDILETLGKNRHTGQKILGFAAEITEGMEDLKPLALGKLKKKNADLIAANRINHGEGAFGTEQAAMAVVDKKGSSEIWGAKSKADIAWDLCSWLLSI